MCKVSIVVPVFNVEKYLVQCLDSLISQTLQEIEIICVNDGSTDGSLEILQKYARVDSRFRIIDKKNEGYGRSMNIGFDNATGEYIGIVEPDDYVDKEMFNYLYRICKQYDLDFVKSDFYRFVTDDGIEKLYYNKLSPKADDYNKVIDTSQNPLTLRWVINTWCGIYKKEFILENNIRHNETPGASFQDNGFCFQTFIYGKKAMIIDKPFYRNRRDNPNSSVANREKVYCMNIEYNYIRSILVQNNEIWNRFSGVYWQRRFHNYVATIMRIAEEFRAEYNECVRKELLLGLKKGEIKKEAFSMDEWINLNRIALGEPMTEIFELNSAEMYNKSLYIKCRRWIKIFSWFIRKYGLKETGELAVYKIRN